MTALYLPHAGSVATLARTDDGWALRDPDGRIRIFDELGYLTADRDRSGNQFTLDYEPTPLGRLFDWHCASTQLSMRNETLSHRRNTLYAYLVGASARPSADPASWTVTATDFDPPFNKWPTDRNELAQLEYARDYLLHLVSLGALPESVDGARRRRLRTVTDPVGRELRFSYTSPRQAVIRRRRGHARSPLIPTRGSSVAWRAPRQPRSGLTMSSPRATRARSTSSSSSSCDPRRGTIRRVAASGGRALLSVHLQLARRPRRELPAHVTGVEQAYGAYFKTFVGCAYPDAMSCLSGAKATVPRYNAGDPVDLAGVPPRRMSATSPMTSSRCGSTAGSSPRRATASIPMTTGLAVSSRSASDPRRPAGRSPPCPRPARRELDEHAPQGRPGVGRRGPHGTRRRRGGGSGTQRAQPSCSHPRALPTRARPGAGGPAGPQEPPGRAGQVRPRRHARAGTATPGLAAEPGVLRRAASAQATASDADQRAAADLAHARSADRRPGRRPHPQRPVLRGRSERSRHADGVRDAHRRAPSPHCRQREPHLPLGEAHRPRRAGLVAGPELPRAAARARGGRLHRYLPLQRVALQRRRAGRGASPRRARRAAGAAQDHLDL